MLDREKGIILNYLYQLVEYGANRRLLVLKICEYLEASDLLQKTAEQRLTKLMEQSPPPKELTQRKFAEFVAELKSLLRNSRTTRRKTSRSLLEINVELLSRHLGLDEFEQTFLGLILRHLNYGSFQLFFNEITRAHLPTMEACAAALGMELSILNEYLRTKGQLLLSGVIHAKTGTGRDLDDLYEVNDTVSNALLRSPGGLDALLELIIGKPAVATLQWDDFTHLGPTRDKLSLFLFEALRQKMPGINILFWGPPGTGKTEFCKSLSAKMGLRLYAIGESDVNGDEPNRRERMGSYRLSQNLLRSQNDVLLMFDEMDDLFEGQVMARFFGGKASVVSKVFVNRLFENNPIPTIWIINDISNIDEAFIRRMSLVLEVKTPPPSTRQQIWSRVLEKNGITFPQEEMQTLAELNIPPAVIDSAARFAKQTGGSAEDFRFAAHGIIHAMRGGRPLPQPEKNEVFQPGLTHADLDLKNLTERLVGTKSRAFSLCLYGPPGTGKSAYLRYLAEQLGMPVLLKRASDLLDMFVGNSEKQIARAFAEAQDREAFLIFDEADSLLGDRRHATRSWEISQVNEMLTWMERHPLPFACTTNLQERLDPASLRRFTFKCCFDYMDETQVKEAFQHFFGMELTTAAGLSRLTAGDFAVVRRKAEVLGLGANAGDLCDLLGQEMACKEGDKNKSIGFCGR